MNRQVEAFSGCCPRTARMNSSTYCHKHTDAFKHSSRGNVFLFACVLHLILISKAVCILNEDCKVWENADVAPLKEMKLFWQQFEGRVQYVLYWFSQWGVFTERLRHARGRPSLWVFGGRCYEYIGVLMQRGCKSEHSVAEKLVNISIGALRLQNCKNGFVHKWRWWSTPLCLCVLFRSSNLESKSVKLEPVQTPSFLFLCHLSIKIDSLRWQQPTPSRKPSWSSHSTQE